MSALSPVMVLPPELVLSKRRELELAARVAWEAKGYPWPSLAKRQLAQLQKKNIRWVQRLLAERDAQRAKLRQSMGPKDRP